MIFYWNEKNSAHATKHSVDRKDADYLVKNARPPFPREIEDEKHLVWGQPPNGRYLQVIFVFLESEDVDVRDLPLLDLLRFQEGEEVVMIVHARPLTEDEKRQFKRIIAK